MTTRARTTVVGIGELLWDCFPDSRRPGGAPANVAFHASQLGHHGVVVSRVGADEDGRALRQQLSTTGLDLAWLQEDAIHPTGTVTVDTSDPGHPTFTIHEEVAWDHLAFDGKLEELAVAAHAVCFGTLAQRSESTRESLHRFLDRASGALRAYDVNLRQRAYDRSWIERSLRAAHVVKLNVEELGVLAALLATGGTRPESFADALRERYGVEIVCITRAERGCLVLEADTVVDLPGRAVEVADAVGAGDAFTAAFLSARLRGWDLEATARFANEVGALVAGRAGAMPVLAREFAALAARCAP